jgi:hypothetical protein
MDDASHKLFVVCHSEPNSFQPQDMESYLIELITFSVQQNLCARLMKLQNKEVQRIFKMFSQGPTLHSVMGTIFENYMHQLFWKHIQLTAEPMFQKV